jgi:hypothetical protein
MEVSSASWLVIVLAIAAANLPFFNDKLFAVLALKGGAGAQGRARKPLLIRLLELVALYLAVGAIGFTLEAKLGNPFPQSWEFYAITACMFLVLAFPGFVARYLRKQHG